jgi:hypothetical protein
MGFARANSISDIPLGPDFGFGQITFTTFIFFAGAAFTWATFTFFAAVFLDTSAFHFFIAAVKASVQGSGRRA